MQQGPTPEQFESAPPKEPRPNTRAKAPADPKIPKPRAKSLEAEIGSLLVMANLGMAPFLKEDVLDDQETLALAKAIDDQAQRSPRFRAMVVRAIETAGGAGLLSVVGIILARRAARHGLIERVWDDRLGTALAFQNMDLTPDQLAAMMQTQTEATINAQSATNGHAPAG